MLKPIIVKFDPFLFANLTALLLLKHNQYQKLAHSLSHGTKLFVKAVKPVSTNYIRTLRQTCLVSHQKFDQHTIFLLNRMEKIEPCSDAIHNGVKYRNGNMTKFYRDNMLTISMQRINPIRSIVFRDWPPNTNTHTHHSSFNAFYWIHPYYDLLQIIEEVIGEQNQGGAGEGWILAGVRYAVEFQRLKNDSLSIAMISTEH